MSNINTIQDLRSELLKAFESVRDDPRRVAQGKEMANLAGKIISSVNLELEYGMMRKETPEIDFLGKSNPALPAPAETPAIE